MSEQDRINKAMADYHLRRAMLDAIDAGFSEDELRGTVEDMIFGTHQFTRAQLFRTLNEEKERAERAQADRDAHLDHLDDVQGRGL